MVTTTTVKAETCGLLVHKYVANCEHWMVKQSHGLFGRPSQVFTWEAGHSGLLLGLWRKTGRDRKPQMRTEAVYMALCIPGCPCTCLVYPLGQVVKCPWAMDHC